MCTYSHVSNTFSLTDVHLQHSLLTLTSPVTTQQLTIWRIMRRECDWTKEKTLTQLYVTIAWFTNNDDKLYSLLEITTLCTQSSIQSSYALCISPQVSYIIMDLVGLPTRWNLEFSLTFDLSSSLILCHSCFRICIAKVWSPYKWYKTAGRFIMWVWSECLLCKEPCQLWRNWASPIQMLPTADKAGKILKGEGRGGGEGEGHGEGWGGGIYLIGDMELTCLCTSSIRDIGLKEIPAVYGHQKCRRHFLVSLFVP